MFSLSAYREKRAERKKRIENMRNEYQSNQFAIDEHTSLTNDDQDTESANQYAKEQAQTREEHKHSNPFARLAHKFHGMGTSRNMRRMEERLDEQRRVGREEHGFEGYNWKDSSRRKKSRGTLLSPSTNYKHTSKKQATDQRKRRYSSSDLDNDSIKEEGEDVKMPKWLINVDRKNKMAVFEELILQDNQQKKKKKRKIVTEPLAEPTEEELLKKRQDRQENGDSLDEPLPQELLPVGRTHKKKKVKKKRTHTATPEVVAPQEPDSDQPLVQLKKRKKRE